MTEHGIRRDLALAIARAKTPGEAIEEVSRVAAELKLEQRHRHTIADLIIALNDVRRALDRKGSRP